MGGTETARSRVGCPQAGAVGHELHSLDDLRLRFITEKKAEAIRIAKDIDRLLENADAATSSLRVVAEMDKHMNFRDPTNRVKNPQTPFHVLRPADGRSQGGSPLDFKASLG